VLTPNRFESAPLGTTLIIWLPTQRLIVAALLVTSVAACAGNAGPQAAAGAAAGGVSGNRGSAALDDADKRRAYAAQIQALETSPSGEPVAWRNPDSGRYGNVVPGPAYQANGATCRQYTETIYIDGNQQIERGAACRNAGGAWNAAN
jgi:surface antigen